MGDDGRLVSEAALVPDQNAPRAARELVAAALRGWRLPGAVASAELVVSELVSNAVQHAGTPLTVRIIRIAGGLLVEVDDAGPGEPHIIPPSERGVGGHGLAVVARLSDAWGHKARAGGKTVWARLLLSGGLPESEAQTARQDCQGV